MPASDRMNASASCGNSPATSQFVDGGWSAFARLLSYMEGGSQFNAMNFVVAYNETSGMNFTGTSAVVTRTAAIRRKHGVQGARGEPPGGVASCRSPKPPQDYTVFTYDDYQSGQPSGPYPAPPNHVVSIREQRYKLARYYDADGNVPDQWEMYDLKTDPIERVNLAYPGHKRTPAQEREYRRLRAKLAQVEQTRLKPL